MHRYPFYLFACALLLPACSKHQSASYDKTTTRVQEVKQPTQPAPGGVVSQGEQAATQAEGGWKKYDAAEREKLELPPPSQQREIASSEGGMTTPPPSSSATQRPTYGNPPGAFTAPGTTRTVRPAQGTTVENETLRGTDVSDAQAEDSMPTDADRMITQRIRSALRDNDSLSYTAKSVEIITRNGNIILKGMVLTDRERWEIERVARAYAGEGQVKNRLEIKNRTTPQN